MCDAGGGTVDLISYEVTREDKLEVKEVTEGTGGKMRFVDAQQEVPAVPEADAL